MYSKSSSRGRRPRGSVEGAGHATRGGILDTVSNAPNKEANPDEQAFAIWQRMQKDMEKRQASSDNQYQWPRRDSAQSSIQWPSKESTLVTQVFRTAPKQYADLKFGSEGVADSSSDHCSFAPAQFRLGDQKSANPQGPVIAEFSYGCMVRVVGSQSFFPVLVPLVWNGRPSDRKQRSIIIQSRFVFGVCAPWQMNQ